MVGYTAEADPDTTSKAIAKELPISPKFSREICRMIRGKKVDDAIRMLEEVVDAAPPGADPPLQLRRGAQDRCGTGKIPEEGRRGHHQGAAKRQEQRGVQGPGRRQHARAHSVRPSGTDHPGYMPRAHRRSTAWDQQTVNIEVILEEVQ